MEELVSITNRKKMWWSFNDLIKILFYAFPEIQTTLYKQNISEQQWKFYQEFETRYNNYEGNIYSNEEEKAMFDAIRMQKSLNSNGLYQNIHLLFKKIYAMANCDYKQAQSIISDYYSPDLNKQSSFTYNTHILIELRSIFARMDLCQNNKIFKCITCKDLEVWKYCGDCNNKHQLVITSNEQKTGKKSNEQFIYCDKLIEAVRPIGTSLKNAHSVNVSMGSMIEAVIAWISMHADATLFQIRKSCKYFCFKCKIFVSDSPSKSEDVMLHVAGYDYYKHYKVSDYLNDYLNDCVDYFQGDNQYYCAKCNDRSWAKRVVYFEKLPSILMIHCNKLIFDFDTFKSKQVDHRIEYPLILDMSIYMEPKMKETVTAEDELVLQNGVKEQEEMLHLLKQRQNEERYFLVSVVVRYFVDTCVAMNIPDDVKPIIINYASDMKINRICKSIYDKQSKDLYVLTGVVFKTNRYGQFEFCLMDLSDKQWIDKIKSVESYEIDETFIVENSKWYRSVGGKVELVSIYNIVEYYENTSTLFYRRFDEIPIVPEKPELNDVVLKECEFYYNTTSKFQ